MVLHSFRRCMRYHAGSMAMGSFIISVVQMLRFALMYVERQSKELRNKNKMVRVLFCAVQICLWCLDKCVRYISRNAYIIVAMRGESFCSSAMHAFWLIAKNLTKVRALLRAQGL